MLAGHACGGGNNHGQLGVHSDNQHQYPQQVHGLGNVGYLSGITAVAAGRFFSMVLKSDGTAVYGWGNKPYGQVDATLQDHSYPAQVGGLAATPPENGGAAICHKSGTPAEKTLHVPHSALHGHLDQGDRLGSCSS